MDRKASKAAKASNQASWRIFWQTRLTPARAGCAKDAARAITFAAARLPRRPGSVAGIETSNREMKN